MKRLCTAIGAVLALAITLLAGPQAQGVPDDLMDRAARLNDMTRDELQRVLTTDSTAQIDATGRMYYVDVAPALMPQRGLAAAAAAPFPLADTWALHSKPGSARTLYLDFDGYDVAGTVWADTRPALPKQLSGYNFEGTAATFTAAELTAVQDLWRLVAEDYAPFDVDVTTAFPGLAAIDRTSAADLNYGTTALITSDPAWNTGLCGGCSGQAYVGVFDHWSTTTDNHQYYQPAMVLAGGSLDNDPFFVAQTASHEVGHNAGLNHDGQGTNPYYDGVDGGLWAPIMGASFYNPVSQWSRGEYASASNSQDDFAVMASNGLPLRTDEAEASTATTPVFSGSGTRTGFVTSAADQDWYRLVMGCTGTLAAAAVPAARGPNLDIVLRLRDAAGAVLAADSPVTTRVSAEVASGLGASLQRSVTSGTYYLEVDGGTASTWAAGGYTSDYGSVGAYSLTASVCDPAPEPPQAVTATALPSAVRAGWTAPANPYAGQPTGYRIFLQKSGQAPVSRDVSTSPLSYTWTGLAPGSGYRVGVSTISGVLVSAAAWSNVVVPTGRPSAPTRVRAASGARGGVSTAKVTWAPPANLGGLPVTHYRVLAQRIVRGNVVKQQQSALLSPSRRSLSMRLARGTWQFKVRASNNLGWSAYSPRTARVTAR